MRTILRLAAAAASDSRSAQRPYRWTGRIAFVFALVRASACRGSILKVSGSMSTKTGLAPSRETVPAVAKKEYAVVITSSPGPTPAAIKAARRASVPEETPTANFEPQNFAISSSRAWTSGPRMKCWESQTRSIAARISSRIGAYWAFRSSRGTFMFDCRKVGELYYSPSPSGRFPMKASSTSLPGVLVLEPRLFGDSRGSFYECYRTDVFQTLGIGCTFVQENHSTSTQGVLRGLHYQRRHSQAKLVRVVQGEIYDVAVDIRRGSPTFGKWAGETLSAANRKQMFVPVGFAHGFLVLSPSAEVIYKVSDFYDKTEERGILWNDPELGIPWPLQGLSPIVNERDARY